MNTTLQSTLATIIYVPLLPPAAAVGAPMSPAVTHTYMHTHRNAPTCNLEPIFN